MFKHRIFSFGALAALFAVIPQLAAAQSIGLGADLVSRYVWRGYDFGESFSVQPGLSLSAGGLEIGTWASYSISADGAGANEHDLYATYAFSLGGSGEFALGVTDYYFPSPDGAKWSNFDSDGEGAHWIELMASFTGPESFPITIMGAFMAYNDPDQSLYVEGSLPFTVGGVDMGLALGMVAGESAFYAVESASLVNLSISASQDLQITDSFALPLSVSYIVNPTAERSFLVFGISLSP